LIRRGLRLKNREYTVVNSFVKTHGLGNDYIVLDEDNLNFELTGKAVQRICNINYGIGSDGILLKIKSDKADFGLKIYNPDGSEAEKSGNGLRIFCKYLYDYAYTDKEEFNVEVKGGVVHAKIIGKSNNKAKTISIDMGKAIFKASEIPTNFKVDEVLDQKILADDKEYEVNCVSVGNPHCVIIKEDLNVDEIKKYGKSLENHSMFPNRINVQFAKVTSRNEAEILIWERGAGFTLASGSSSCAVASILKKKNLIDDDVKIKMPGGKLKIHIDSNWNINMTGEVRQIAEGILSNELIEDLEK
jgi:diaminopimelate epimerase